MCVALALEIGAVVAALFAGLVPIQPQPVQPVEDDLDGFGRVARVVGVLDAQDEFAAGVPGVEPVEERGAGAADVQKAGGRRGETDTDRECS